MRYWLITFQDAQSEKNAVEYAFGSAFDDENGNDEGLGIHNNHTNQVNPLHRGRDKVNYIYQDDVLLFEFPNDDPWIALFLILKHKRRILM